MSKGQIYKIKLFFLYIYAFSLGYEYWDPFGFRSELTVLRGFAILYFLFSLSDIKNNFSLNQSNKKFIFPLLGLWLWLILIEIFYSSAYPDNFIFLQSIIQLIILFLLIFNDVKRNPSIVNKVIFSFILGMFSVSLLILAGIGTQTGQHLITTDIYDRRIYFFGMNPNVLGGMAALAIILVFLLIIETQFLGKKRYLLLLTLPNLLSVIGITASRGAFVMVILGLSAFFFLKKTKTIYKLLYVVLGIITIFVLSNYLDNFTTLQNRLTEAYDNKDLNGRLIRWKTAWDTFAEHPLTGIGPIGAGHDLKEVIGKETITHNVFLQILSWGGLIGFLLLFLFFYATFKNVWRQRKALRNITGITILLIVFLVFMKDGGGFNNKMVWLFIALITPLQVAKK